MTRTEHESVATGDRSHAGQPTPGCLAVAADVLRHRIILSFEAEANGISPDNIIERIIARLPVA